MRKSNAFKKIKGLLCCVAALLLAGCASPAGELSPTPRLGHATPPPALITMPIAAVSPMQPLSGLTYDRPEDDSPVRNWADGKSFYAGESAQALSGWALEGSREGNTVQFRLAQEETAEYMVGELSLAAADGRTGVFPVVTPAGLYQLLCHVSFADFDGDGTDEIVLFIERGASGGVGDLHVYTYREGEVKEIYTALGGGEQDPLRQVYKETLGTEEACTGAQVILSEEGLALRVFAYTQNKGDVLFAELLYRGGEWTPLWAFTPFTQEQQQAYLGSLEPALQAAGIEQAYMDFYGQPVNLGGGELLDTLLIHRAYTADGALYILLEGKTGQRSAGGAHEGGRLLGSFACEGVGGYKYQFADLNGDDAPELLLGFTKGAGEAEIYEMHLLQIQGEELKEVLTFISAPTAAEQRVYQNTLFTLPNAGALTYESEKALNYSARWGEVVLAGGRRCIQLEHLEQAGEAIAYSRIAWQDEKWMLIEQRMIEEEVWEPEDAQQEQETEPEMVPEPIAE